MVVINTKTFHGLMTAFCPFEDAPHLAVAVSGGADSMALVLLADSWARDKGGTVTALIVDHGLRVESAAEARQVQIWLENREIDHIILRWKGRKPSSGIQAAARRARYELMADWCKSRDILHLLVAHHGDDQTETILLRQERDSGPDGLSGMAAGRVVNGIRLLRPLLTIRRKDTEATLMAWRQPWLDDPSNTEERFARTTARRKLSDNEPKYIYLQNLARKSAKLRLQRSHQRAVLAAQNVRMHPAGFCWLNFFERSDEFAAKSLLADILLCIGGGNYRPKRNRIDRLYQKLMSHDVKSGRTFQGHTLAGARILPWASEFLICRETGRLPPPISLNRNCSGRWDRFVWNLCNEGAHDLTIGKLGETGWQQIQKQTSTNLPVPVRTSLPSLKKEEQVLAVPHLNFISTEYVKKDGDNIQFFANFSPPLPLQPDGLLLV